MDTNTSLELRSLTDPRVLWATGLGVGFAKPAPGTWGSLAALAVWWFLLADLSVWTQLAICFTYFLSGWWASAMVCERYDIADAPEIVADEVAGMWLALLLAPKVWWLALIAFALFRLLDIAKPGPIGKLDRDVHGGLGVMLDDVVAGAMVSIVLYVSLWAFRMV